MINNSYKFTVSANGRHKWRPYIVNIQKLMRYICVHPVNCAGAPVFIFKSCLSPRQHYILRQAQSLFLWLSRRI